MSEYSIHDIVPTYYRIIRVINEVVDSRNFDRKGGGTMRDMSRGGSLDMALGLGLGPAVV